MKILDDFIFDTEGLCFLHRIQGPAPEGVIETVWSERTIAKHQIVSFGTRRRDPRTPQRGRKSRPEDFLGAEFTWGHLTSVRKKTVIAA
jgi:hypothetical protein